VDIVKGRSPSELERAYSQKRDDQLEEEGLSPSSLEIETLTDKEREVIKKNVKKASNTLEYAKTIGDEGQRDKAQKELDMFKEHVLAEHGIAIRVTPNGTIELAKKSRPGPETEKARSNVKNQITHALSEIEKSIPSLAKHLRNHIKKGVYCEYTPDEKNPVDWYISW